MILEVKVGEKVDAGSVLCRLYYTREERLEEAAEMVEDAFRISVQSSGRAQADPRSGRLVELHGRGSPDSLGLSSSILGDGVPAVLDYNRQAIKLA